MERKIIISVERQEKRIAIIDNGSLEQYFCERPDHTRLMGNIYKAKVESVVSGIQAAFINLGLKKNGFLYITDITKPLADYKEIIEEEAEELEPTRFKEDVSIQDVLRPNQEVLVQVVKDNISTKGPRLTTNISLPGRYLVLMPYQKCFGISKRIHNQEERERLRSIIKDFRLPRGAGLIVRTFAEDASKKELIRDFKYLMHLLKRINHNSKRQSSPALIHQEYDLISRVIRDYFSEDVETLIVDDKKEFVRISHFLKFLTPDLKSKLSFYAGKKPLFEEYNLEDSIERMHKRNVKLKSGGYIIIEPTESLISIDVNTGRFVKKGSLEETAFITNKEAAVEISRQLKLRDLGGIIIIDFIDMPQRHQRQKIFRLLLEALRSDRAKTKVLPVSDLGVLEMTRQRVGKSLESASSQTCCYCGGKGLVKSISTIAIEALRGIKKFLRKTENKELSVFLHPKVASYIFNQQRQEFTFLEEEYGAKINIEPDANQHLEDIRITKGFNGAQKDNRDFA
ncbi:MAG: Rne/Rng family ribonuclease [Candidatus Omnitrophica bacterium]|nr:Rne/Rng family ribonuclease [Candidatus Omnitrophota bacterium]